MNIFWMYGMVAVWSVVVSTVFHFRGNIWEKVFPAPVATEADLAWLDPRNYPENDF